MLGSARIPFPKEAQSGKDHKIFDSADSRTGQESHQRDQPSLWGVQDNPEPGYKLELVEREIAKQL